MGVIAQIMGLKHSMTVLSGVAPDRIALGPDALRELAIETHADMRGGVSLAEQIAYVEKSAAEGTLFVAGLKVVDRVGAD